MKNESNRVVQSVLVVDDWEPQLGTWERGFRMLGRSVLAASTRSHAIEAARANKPEAALVDLFLGQDSGIDVIADLRGLDPDLYLILVSSHISVEYAMLAVEAGANWCYPKTITCQQVLNRIENGTSPPLGSNPPSLDDIEWEHIARVLEDCDGNISHAAAALGIHRQSLQRKIKRHAPRRWKS